ncbi:MAG: DUF763 domain-containing protein [Bacteroidetes bacterium]|jgi:hypothetical protein|nr:DUF763 domain-containing protein [Bacteroidota bacterium]
MKRSGQADLPLHYGRVPAWLYERMAKMGGAITEAIVQEHGPDEFIRRISDPFWFQSLGAVLGMDWHSSGITTSVMGALKQAINPISNDLGLYIAGGRGKHSLQTPNELEKIARRTSLNGQGLVRASKLTAKIDNTAIQDGYNLYLHSFIVSKTGEWSVVQQGMNDANRMARRYHWHSARIKSFVDEPHAAICGENMGDILNLTDHTAAPTRKGMLNISHESPAWILKETKKMIMPNNHDVQLKDVDLKRLGTVLSIAYDHKFREFEDLLLVRGLGPKTVRALTLISEVIHGTPSRFRDPARFSFAHGGKDGHPFPVQTTVYDQSISQLKNAVHLAKIGYTDKKKAIQKLSQLTLKLEKDFMPNPGSYEKYLQKEKDESQFVRGRTVFDNKNNAYDRNHNPRQLRLF